MDQKIVFPYSGRTCKNRLGKGAMSENMANPQTGFPNQTLYNLYRSWAEGGIGMQLTGNVMIDRRYRENPRNVCLEAIDENRERLAYYERWAQEMKMNDCLAIVQISHPGRQCPMSVTTSPLAPSAIKLNMKGIPSFLSPVSKPKVMTDEQIEDVIERFATTARLCEKAGFDGIEVHSAHGYLLSQFLSPHTNRRSDKWGGSAENRRRLLFRVIDAIRSKVDESFVVGVKLNSADFQRGGFTEEESLDVIHELGKSDRRIDFIEISGGTYENMEAMKAEQKRQSTIDREAYFLEFAKKVRAAGVDSKSKGTLLMVTGGFRTATAMHRAVSSGNTDICGLARPLCVEPDLPNRLISGESERALVNHVALNTPIASLNKTMGPGLQAMWHAYQMERIADGLPPDLTVGYTYFLTVTFARNYIWDPASSSRLTRVLIYGLFFTAILYVLKKLK